ncbi:MAG: ABC transporter ATP-binding protein [Betaproteobacteria bacterium]|nr:ABC transporter ATP-binding protein [Betaproteobacteria bacterium]
MHDPFLRVAGLRVAFGSREILRGVDFSLAEGESVALLGPNGSGKSTCLNAISGLVAVTGGDIAVAGARTSGWPVHRVVRHGVVQVSQSRDLFPDLCVEDNLRLGAHTRDAAEAENELPGIYRLFPRLDNRRRQAVRSLSGGEQQMVAIGRALMSRPRLMLLDEPSGGLSPQLVADTARTMTALRDRGMTMLLVEQNLGLALKAADRYLILRDGEVADGGAVSALAGSYDDVVRSIYL